MRRYEWTRGHPLYSRCSLDQDRWYWVVFPPVLPCWIDWDNILASGYASNAEDARQAALAAVSTAQEGPAGCALGKHREICKERRRQRPPSKSKDTAQIEYLYRDILPEIGDWYCRPVRIIRKTKKSVFVEVPHKFDDSTYRLDRAELEREGSAYSRAARDFFYTLAREQRLPEPIASPELVVLGLKARATRDQIVSAYRRLAMKHHPDRGGDPEEFKKVTEAYERALSRMPVACA
jgi:hypothetical protein